ncbi:acyl-CoA N-acyltransferase [Roridomyces roridus]|uniref:Acyl-CoA N-acyltransferase n=1 Tax=Roridomyces roridus TaxID=1738132 RepID=A0AAD7C5H8_9AGAR|nr:acyl-CoA N-acyltransferase [Roridomyces roridus]
MSLTTSSSDLESPRVKLTPYLPPTHDSDFFTQITAHPDLTRWFALNFTPAAVQKLLEDPNNLLFAIIDKASSKFAGVIGLLHISSVHLTTEVGPVICFPEFQRTHVASHAIGIALRYCLELPKDGGMGLRRVQWTANALNGASIKVAERMGFKMEGTSRWTHVLSVGREGREAGQGRGEGPGRDSVLLAICWDDWENGGRELVDEKTS